MHHLQAVYLLTGDIQFTGAIRLTPDTTDAQTARSTGTS